MMKEATGVIAPITENIPERLVERPQWVCWRLEERPDGDLTKVPYEARTGRRVDPTDLMTWTTFEEAVAAYEASGGFYDGIGFVFCSADPFTGIDFDGCRDPETGETEGWAKDIIDRAGKGYVEVSASGTASTSSWRARSGAAGCARTPSRCARPTGSSRSPGRCCETPGFGAGSHRLRRNPDTPAPRGRPGER